jgi:hypothetical protein
MRFKKIPTTTFEAYLLKPFETYHQHKRPSAGVFHHHALPAFPSSFFLPSPLGIILIHVAIKASSSEYKACNREEAISFGLKG